MGFSVTLPGAALADAAHWIAALAPRRPTSPALAGVLLVADDYAGGSLTLSATDQNTTGQLTARDAAVDGQGRRLVSARLLADIARTIGKEPEVVLSDSDDGNRLDVSAGRGASWSLPLMPAEDYPKLPTPVTPVARVNAVDFSRAVERASLALSEPMVPPFFGGIVLESTGDAVLSVVAGSSWRIAVVDLTWTPALSEAVAEPAGFPAVLVPAPVLSAAIGAARDAQPDDEVVLHSDGLTFAVSGSGYHVVGRIGAEVPTWRSGDMVNRLDRRFGHVDVSAESLKTTLDRVAVALEVKEPLQIDVTEEAMSVSSSASSKAAAAHHVEVLDFDGKPCCYGLNLEYARDMVACVGAPKLRLEFVGPPHAPMTLVRAVEDTGEVVDGIRISVAPVRLPKTAKKAA